MGTRLAKAEAAPTSSPAAGATPFSSPSTERTTGRGSPIQAWLPAEEHWEYKLACLKARRSMTEVGSELLRLYATDAETWETLRTQAAAQGIPVWTLAAQALAEWLSDQRDDA